MIGERPMTDAWSPAAMRVEGLEVAYAGRTVLANVSMEIPAGKITAVIGPSGCGKSSFLIALNRISDVIPGCTVRGQVVLRDAPIYEPRVDVIALRKRVGMIFQRPNPFPLSIRQNIQLAMREHRVCRRAEMQPATERVLRDVGLWDEVRNRLDAPAMSLSGGQQQRLCIARALALQPEVLLFDEPCSALDPIASRTVEELIVTLRGRTTIVIVTHNLSQAKRIADEVAMFWYVDGAGKMIEHGSAERVFQSPSNPITAAYIQGHQG